MRKDVLSVLLSASLLVGMMPASGMGKTASAAADAGSIVAEQSQDDTGEEEVTASGTLTGTLDGTDEVAKLTWSFTEASGTLTIGTENPEEAVKMRDYASENAAANVPWYEYQAAIKKLVFTGGVTYIGNNTFYHNATGKLKSYLSLEEVDITQAKKLTKIGENVFGNKTKLSTFHGWEQLVEIGTSCFLGTGFTEVSCPNLTSLGANAFQSCSALKAVSLPKITELPGKAFSCCTTLEEINCPEVTKITGDETFSQCYLLKEIDFPKLSVISGSSVFAQCTVLEKIAMPQLTILGSKTFYQDTGLKEIGFSKATYIGASAFEGCNELLTLNLPEACYIGASAFRSCYSLVKVNIPKVGGTYTDGEGNQAQGGVGASRIFTGCYSLAYLDLPVGITSLSNLGLNANNANLKRIYFRGTAESAQTDITGVSATIYVPTGTGEQFSGVTSSTIIETGDFDSLLAKERKVILSGETMVDVSEIETWKTDNPVAVYNQAGDSIPAGDIIYEYYQDRRCTTPATGSDATEPPSTINYYNPAYYVRIKVAENAGYFETFSNILEIKVVGEISSDDKTWTYHTGTETLKICDESVVSKDYESYLSVPWGTYRSSIKYIVLDSGVELTKIGSNVFNYCRNLQEFDIPDTVTSVGENAFCNCASLSSTWKLTLKELGASAFDGCYNLKGSIALNSSVTEVPTYAFRSCKALNAIGIPDTVTSFGAECFNDCQSVTEVNIPSGVTSLPSFKGCSSLKSVTIPSGITRVGVNHFDGCSSLEKINLEQVTSIGNYAFNNCKALQQIDLSKLTELGNFAFVGAGIRECVIPSTVTTIGHSVFKDCNNLQFVCFENDNYTTETLATNNKDTTTRCDAMFQGVPGDAMVICDGSTYETLSGYAGDLGDQGWKSDILYHSNAFDNLYTKALDKMGQFDSIDYDAQAWEKFQTILTEAGKLAEEGETKADRVLNKLEAEKRVKNSPKVLLKNVCDQADALIEKDYNTQTESWKIYQEILGEAKKMAASDTVYEISAIAESEKTLRQTIRNLELLPTDTAVEALEEVITDTKDLKESDYTVDSWKLLQAALEEAEMMQAIGTVSQIEGAQAKLSEAMNSLVKASPEAAVAALEKAIADIEDLKESDYTGDSWKMLQAALEEAETMKTIGTVSQIEGAQAKLSEAIKSLVKASTDTAVAALEKVIASVKDLKESDYTGDSWKMLQAALEEAETMKTIGTVSQIEGAQAKLSEAVKSLVKTNKRTTTGTNSGTKQGNNKQVAPKVKKVTIKSVKSKKKKSLLVQWKKISGVAGYQIQISTSKKFKGKKTYTVKKAKTVKKTIKRLKSKKKYYVRVRAYKTVKGKKYPGNWSKIKKVKVK